MISPKKGQLTVYIDRYLPTLVPLSAREAVRGWVAFSGGRLCANGNRYNKNVTECYGRLEKTLELSSFCLQRTSQIRVRFALQPHSIEHISCSSVDIRVVPVNSDGNYGPHQPEGLGLALAPCRTRLRAGFVVRTKTESKRAAGEKPAALSFFGLFRWLE